MRYVRQGAKRRSAPDVLTAAEIKALVDHLALRERTLVLLAAATGLRQSELFGLKWRDVDVRRGELTWYVDRFRRCRPIQDRIITEAGSIAPAARRSPVDLEKDV